MSALPPKADIDEARWNVRFGPIADIRTGRRYFRRSSTGSFAMFAATLRASSLLSNFGCLFYTA